MKKKTRLPARRTKAEIKSQLPAVSLFVRNRREELGYTQEELAARSGVSLRFLKEFEHGKTTARLDKVTDLLHFLGAELTVTDKAKS
jgi:HTH-type transcriptional regulator/antitoxin HipB